ncbi:MAG TPA: hypothetical protein VFH78_09980 [Candidatus Thermoplasmatota archaeon]|nr:hypothetical protein [Candidatus Thermoplasmatota archaeon]
MRAPLLAALLVLAALAPTVAAGSSGCFAIPPGAYAGVGSCSVSFVSTAGTMLIRVEALAGSVGEVLIHADGPGASDIYAACTLQFSSGSCLGPVALFFPMAGAWTVTARATNANVGGGDSRVWMDVTYP